MHFVEAGDGPVVVLLHGFPEFWYSWRFQIETLAQAGFRVLAPDLRGYGRTEKPPRVADYAIDRLMDDVVGLIRLAGTERAHVVGHDWGGIVACCLGMHRDEALEKLVVVNAPHPGAFARDFFRTRQWLHSSYMAFFQIPKLPEALLGAAHAEGLLRRFVSDTRNPEAFDSATLAAYRDALTQPGALTGGLNYYRAAARDLRGRTGDIRTTATPTMVVWGERDRYLLPSMSTGLETWFENLRVERLPDAGHWAQLDEPERVGSLLTEFFSQP